MRKEVKKYLIFLSIIIAYLSFIELAGSETISHKDLTGADLHIPKTHQSSHQKGGSDALTGNLGAITVDTFTVGANAAGYDVKFYGTTSAKYLLWDASEDKLFVNDVDITTGAGAPTNADYLVGTANASLSAEIVVGTTPGGQLGGTWASPTIDDLFLLNTGDSGAGNYDIQGTFTIGVNATGYDVKFYGTTAGKYFLWDESEDKLFVNNINISTGGTHSKSFVILNPIATDDYPVWCTPYAITIKRVRLQCLGGTNIVGMLTECDAEGINPVVVDDSDITATANNSVDDDGSLSNPSIDALDYVGWATTSISGTPTSATITFDYTIN